MINFLKSHFENNKSRYAIWVVLLISLFCHLWYSFHYTIVWWDEAVYVSMGKYIATGGHLGYFEIFRPPLFPLFYSVLYMLNLPLILVGKFVVVLACVAITWIIYLIAENIKKGSGIFAGIFLTITPAFFAFSKLAITDIISAFFATLALYLYSREKYFWTGLSIAAAFLLRFPQGLMAAVIAMVVVIDCFDKDIVLWIKNLFKKGLFILSGFLILTIPYFISNYFLYDSFLKPLILGNEVIGGYSFLYDLGTWYYARELWATAPFLYLSLLTPFVFLKKDFLLDVKSKKNLFFTIIAAVIFGVYFFLQPHKELRYSIAFIPYVAVLAGVGFYFLIHKINNKFILNIVLIVAAIVVFFRVLPMVFNTEVNIYRSVDLEYGKLSGVYLSTTPNPAVFGDVGIVEFFDSYPKFNDAFARRADTVDGIVMNSCDIFCEDRSIGKYCTADVALIEKSIEKKSFKKSYEYHVDQCRFLIYKK